jgi:iron(III) transport system permease protein
MANLIAGAVLCFAFAMLEVSDSLVLAVREKYYPVTKAIYALFGRPDGAFVASALGVLGMLLLALSLIVAGRFLGKRMGELFRIG